MRKSEMESKLLQRRRFRAGRLLERGVAQAEVARRVGVTRTTVSQWNAQLKAGGLDALRAADGVGLRGWTMHSGAS